MHATYSSLERELLALELGLVELRVRVDVLLGADEELESLGDAGNARVRLGERAHRERMVDQERRLNAVLLDESTHELVDHVRQRRALGERHVEAIAQLQPALELLGIIGVRQRADLHLLLELLQHRDATERWRKVDLDRARSIGMWQFDFGRAGDARYHL